MKNNIEWLFSWIQQQNLILYLTQSIWNPATYWFFLYFIHRKVFRAFRFLQCNNVLIACLHELDHTIYWEETNMVDFDNFHFHGRAKPTWNSHCMQKIRMNRDCYRWLTQTLATFVHSAIHNGNVRMNTTLVSQFSMYCSSDLLIIQLNQIESNRLLLPHHV